MNIGDATASATPREGMTDLYDKIIKYVYEMRMIEMNEYLYGMNRKEIDVEKAYEIIINAPDCESNAVMNVWKGRLVDPQLQVYVSSRVEKNESRAIAFYRKAVDLDIERIAEAGDQYAQACLGLMYHFGRGIDENNSTAVKWYRKAAEQGYADAQYNLGVMFHFGQDVDQNYTTAVEWFRKAAEQGHVKAQFVFGSMYYYGQGVDQNYSTAVEWYLKAAEQGYANAQYNLGVIYEYGYGVDQNDSIAVEWYRKAAEQGHVRSQMYEKGKGVYQNYSTAVEWFRKAAHKGNAYAQRNLGRLTNKRRGLKNFFSR